MNDSMQELMAIHEQQRKEQEQVYENAYGESQAALRRRVQLASQDPALNLDINDNYLEDEDE